MNKAQRLGGTVVVWRGIGMRGVETLQTFVSGTRIE